MNTIFKVLRTEEDYNSALKMVEDLMNKNPKLGSNDSDRLDLLVSLIKDYESKIFPKSLPDPIEAIKFRMEQSNLKPKDLIPYIGSRSKVSEILSYKRSLTISMIRALEEGLGIPSKVLIQKIEKRNDSQYENWSLDIVKAMDIRGYFGNMSLKEYSKTDLLKSFFPSQMTTQPIALFRKTNYRIAPRTDKNALTAWTMRVLQKAKEIKISSKYKHGIINLEFMQNLVKLSVKNDSPLFVKKYLEKYGIKLVIEPPLPKTHLDGVVILSEKDNPIIGLTIRYDRLDNFWFTLMHELAHIALHYNQDVHLFYDELEEMKGSDIASNEKEADLLAGESLVPSDKWEISPAKLMPSSIAASSLAKELGIHVAIIAGKIRHEGDKWIYLNNIINNNKVRHLFPKEKWDK